MTRPLMSTQLYVPRLRKSAGTSKARAAAPAADNEPTSFWTYVGTAIDQAVPEEVRLVLDDDHLVRDPQIGQRIAFLLEHLPPSVHIVLSTRADPDLCTCRKGRFVKSSRRTSTSGTLTRRAAA